MRTSVSRFAGRYGRQQVIDSLLCRFTATFDCTSGLGLGRHEARRNFCYAASIDSSTAHCPTVCCNYLRPAVVSPSGCRDAFLLRSLTTLSADDGDDDEAEDDGDEEFVDDEEEALEDVDEFEDAEEDFEEEASSDTEVEDQDELAGEEEVTFEEEEEEAEKEEEDLGDQEEDDDGEGDLESGETYEEERDEETHQHGSFPDGMLSKAVSRLLTEAQASIVQGRLVEAEQLLRQGLETAVESLGEDSIDLAPVLEQLAELQLLMDNPSSAASSARRALTLAEAYYGPDDVATAVCALRLGAILASSSEGEELDEAQSLLSSSQGVLQEGMGEQHEGVGEALYYQGLLQLRRAIQEHSVEAVEEAGEQLLKGAGLMYEALGGSHHLLLTALLQHERLLSQAPPDSELALPVLDQALALQQQMSPTSPLLPTLQLQKGTLLYSRGDYGAAVACFEAAEEAVQQLPESRDDEGEQTAAARDLLMQLQHRKGMALALAGEGECAQTLLEEAASFFADQLGDDSPLAAETHFALDRLRLAEHLSAAGDLLGDMGGRLERLGGELGEEHALLAPLQQEYDRLVAKMAAAQE